MTLTRWQKSVESVVKPVIRPGGKVAECIFFLPSFISLQGPQIEEMHLRAGWALESGHMGLRKQLSSVRGRHGYSIDSSNAFGECSYVGGSYCSLWKQV